MVSRDLVCWLTAVATGVLPTPKLQKSVQSPDATGICVSGTCAIRSLRSSKVAYRIRGPRPCSFHRRIRSGIYGFGGALSHITGEHVEVRYTNGNR